jgi:hypothetical protein
MTKLLSNLEITGERGLVFTVSGEVDYPLLCVKITTNRAPRWLMIQPLYPFDPLDFDREYQKAHDFVVFYTRVPDHYDVSDLPSLWQFLLTIEPGGKRLVDEIEQRFDEHQPGSYFARAFDRAYQLQSGDAR